MAAVVFGLSRISGAAVFNSQDTGNVIVPPTPVLPTKVYPKTDVSVGQWTSTAATLSGAINETVANDASYISTAAASTCEMTLDEAVYPGGANQVISYRAYSANSSMLTVTLKQAAVTIAQWTHQLTPTPTLYRQTLTTAQRALIVAGAINVTLATT
ncbi:hypothetical protein ACO0K3_03715 [Undibacterium sp. Rencai35W]|uniref:hypothetical protein n=1 Tax=Undibacterium sp. Rencai35W TaxID=3413046 RepID=UPI003BF09C9A